MTLTQFLAIRGALVSASILIERDTRESHERAGDALRPAHGTEDRRRPADARQPRRRAHGPAAAETAARAAGNRGGLMSMKAAAHYSNLNLVRPRKPTAVSRKAEANEQRDAETRLKRKVEQAHAVLTALEARSKRLALQMKELQQRKQAADRRAELIEDRILREMREAGLEKLAGLRTIFSVRPAGVPALVVDDGKLIPSEYIKETLVSSPDNPAIKAALARGEDVAGVRLVQSVSLIRK